MLNNDALNFVNAGVGAASRSHRGRILGDVEGPCYLELARPFTLIAPALGFFSGAITAVGAYPHETWSWTLIAPALIGAVMAMVFNAGNNALNQIYDLEIDRVNKGSARCRAADFRSAKPGRSRSWLTL